MVPAGGICVPQGTCSSLLNFRFTRMVALVSLRDIYAGEELFSSYFTIVEGEKNNTSGQSGQN